MLYFIWAVLLVGNIKVRSQDIIQNISPSNLSRDSTLWEWCDCGLGLNQVVLWPNDQIERNVTIKIDSVQWIKFEGRVSSLNWKCDGMNSKQSSVIKLKETQWLSLLAFQDLKDSPLGLCGRKSGRLSINTWDIINFMSSVPFTSHTEGYACFKIPSLLRTAEGTLIAFSEARYPNCGDFDRTTVVYKRSNDDGKSWSPLKNMVDDQFDTGECGHELVIGNVAPVQLRKDSQKHPGRILVPYSRNNFKLWIIYSDDDGLTWTGNREIPNVSETAESPDCDRDMSYFGLNVDELKLENLPDFYRFFEQICNMDNPFKNPNWTSKLKGPWQFIGLGPAGSLQLKSGRILVPGYHSPIRGLSGVPGKLPISQLFNNFAKGFVLISDDFGENWRLGDEWPVGEGADEHQLLQLEDGTVLSNSRSLSTGSPQFRVQARSYNEGDSFEETAFTNIPQPFNGCQGSAVVGELGRVFVTSPNPSKTKSLLQDLIDFIGCSVVLSGRNRLSLWISRDYGRSYELDQEIDPGLSAQTSLQYFNNKLYLLYEQADPAPLDLEKALEKQILGNLEVLLPSRLIYREVSC